MKTKLSRFLISFALLFTANLAMAESDKAEEIADADPKAEPLVTSLQRLQASLRIPTVSDTLDQESTQNSFRAHRALLEKAYPKVFGQLKQHEVGPFSILLELSLIHI